MHKSNKKPLGSLLTSIGELEIHLLTAKDISTLKNYGQDLVDPNLFIRQASSKICRHVSIEDKSLKKNEYLLSNDELQKLTLEDLEKISDLYIKKYPFSKSRIEEKDNQIKVIVEETDEPPIAREPNETSINYLYRLLQEEETSIYDFPKHLIKTFSPGLIDRIADTLTLGKSVINPIPKDRNRDLSSILSPIADTSDISRLSSELSKANEITRNKPLLDILEATRNSIRFLDKVNQTQTEIAGEIKRSADSGEQAARSAFYIATASLFVTVFSIVGQFILVWAAPDPTLQAIKMNSHLETINMTLLSVKKELHSTSQKDFIVRKLNHELNDLKLTINELEDNFTRKTPLNMENSTQAKAKAKNIKSNLAAKKIDNKR